MLHVVAYDIPSDRRRLKVANTLLDYGVRVQESVFECLVADNVRLERMAARLTGLIQADEDAIRIVPVCGSCAAGIRILGRGKPTTDPDVYVI